MRHDVDFFDSPGDTITADNLAAIAVDDLIDGPMPNESEPVTWLSWIIVKSEGALFYMVPLDSFNDSEEESMQMFASITGVDLGIVKAGSVVVDDNAGQVSHLVVAGYGCWVLREKLVGLTRIGSSELAGEAAREWLAAAVSRLGNN